MKFQTKTSSLTSALQTAVSVILSNPVLPILKDVLFKLEGDQLSLTSSDMLNTIVTTIDVTGETDGVITIDGKLLLNIVNTLGEGMVQLSFVSMRAVLTTVEGRYEFPVNDPHDFPKVPEVESATNLEIPTGIFKEAISRTLFAISTDEARPAISSLLIEVEKDNVKFVSTDAHRLAEFVTVFAVDQEAKILISRKSVSALKPLLTSEKVIVNYNKSHISFGVDRTTVYSRLTDERYPDYKAIIPSPSGNNMIINRSQLLSAVKRLLFLANNFTKCVAIEFASSGINMAVEDSDFNKSAKETLGGRYSGAVMSIGFSGKYLAEILSVMDSEEVNIEVTSPKRPALIRQEGEDEYTVLVMPLAI